MVLGELIKIESEVAFKFNLPEFSIICFPPYSADERGVASLGANEFLVALDGKKGICCVEVKYIEESSVPMFSIMGSHPGVVCAD